MKFCEVCLVFVHIAPASIRTMAMLSVHSALAFLGPPLDM